MKRFLTGVFIMLLMSTLSFAQEVVVVISLAVSPEEAFITVQSNPFQFTAEVYDSEGNIVETEVVWSVEGEIGEIDENGLFTPAASGDGFVIAAVGEISAQATVLVAEIAVYGFPVQEGETFVVYGINYPLDYMNGMKVHFPEGAFSEEIVFSFTLPTFASIDDESREVNFGKDIISAVTIHVLVNGEVVSPYNFDIPIEVSIPYDIEVLNNLGIDPEDLGLFFVTDTGELDESGIDNVVVDPEAGVVTGDVEHFSDIAVAPKSAVPTLVEDDTIPEGFALSQNYPNPFNPETIIPYRITETSNVKITIYNVVGQHVKTLVNEFKPSGSYSVTWDGTDEAGRHLNSGLYFYRIQAGNSTQTRKLMLMK